MTKNIFKKIIAVLIACVSAFCGVASMIASAATQEDVYMIMFPRSGDVNANAEWGHGDLRFANGWKADASEWTTLRALNGYEGEVCYCIETGVGQHSGDLLESLGEDFWLNYPETLNSTISPDSIKLLIGRIMMYGYKGNISTSWTSTSDDADNIAKIYATQLLIWETVVGERDEAFNHIDTGNCDKILQYVSQSHPLYDKIMYHYAEIERSVKNHIILPSGFAKSTSKMQSYEMKWDGTQYVLRITDTNAMLENCEFSAEQSGFEFDVNGNVLTITAKELPAERIVITASKAESERCGVVTWSDGLISQNTGIQDVVSYAENVKDPVNGYLQIVAKYGDLRVQKNSEDGIVQGVIFRLYGTAANGENVDMQALTNSNGIAEFVNVPVGSGYILEEVDTSDRYVVPDAQNVTIEWNKVTEKEFTNVLKKSSVKIVKKDAETGNIIPVAGIGFKVWDCTNECYVVQTVNNPTSTDIDTFYTDETGTLMLPNELVYGNYELHEVQSASGYVLDSIPVPFTVDGTVDTVVVEKTNKVQKGRVSVQKSGDSFTTVNEASSSYTDENGELVVNLTTYTPIFEEKGLAGAVFEITAAEDIVTADGTIRAKKGEVVATLTTNENGYAESDLLYLGKYEIAEITAPYGYVKNDAVQTVELPYAGQEIEVRDTVNQAFINDYQGVEIVLSKFMEQDEIFNIGYGNEYLSVHFGLFAAEEIIAADGTSIPADGMIAEVSLGEDMAAKFNARLPFGRYYVQEIATDEHYMLNGEKYLVKFEYMGQEMTTVFIDCGQFTNKLKRGNAHDYKMNENDEPLANALFGLFAIDTTEFTADSAIMTDLSDETGYFEFTEIPYGEYVIREIEAPTGYILSDEIYPVSITEDGDTVEITAENKAITVEIAKQDIYGEELVGAKMQLIDSEGYVVEEWVSVSTNHVVTELPVGKYTLKEIAAPDGYIIATDISFEVFEDGSVVVENMNATATTEDGYPLIVMVDEAEILEIKNPPEEITDIPKTGVYTKFPLVCVLYIGLFTTLIIILKGRDLCLKHRKSKEE